MANELAIPAKQIEIAAKAVLEGEAPEGLGSDPEAATRMILERILQADSFEDAFAPQTLPGWRDLEGIPMVVSDFRFNRSGFTQGSPIYAVVDVTRLDDGSELTVTVGGRNVLMQLLVAAKNGWIGDAYPVTLASKETAEGYRVLWLVDARHDAEKAAARSAAQSEEVPY